MTKLSYALSMIALTGVAGAAGDAAATTIYTQTLGIASLDPATIVSGTPSISITPITIAGKGAPQFYFVSDYAPDVTGGDYDNGSNYVFFDTLVTAQDVSEALELNAGFASNTTYLVANPYAGTAYSPSALGTKSFLPGLPAAGESFTEPGIVTGFYKSPNVNDFTDPSDPNWLTDVGDVNDLSYIDNYYYGSPDYYAHVEFDPAGTEYVGTFTISSDGGLASISYAAAPEPEAWALLVAGVGLAGGALRRSRRSAAAPAA